MSHDRYFINRVCDRLIVFDGGKVDRCDGKYRTYEKRKEEAEDGIYSGGTTAVKKKDKPISQSKESARRAHRMSFLEEKMAVLQDEITALEDKMHNDESVYSDYTQIQSIQERIDELKAKLAPLEEEWLQLSETE